jgi:molybdate transport system permease protein
LDIKKGAYVSIIGENGSAKTTLIKLILGLLHPLKGTIQVQTRKIGYVPQIMETFNSQFPITVSELIKCHMKILKIKDKASLERCLNIIGMNDFKNSLIGKFLSNFNVSIVFSGAATIIASVVVSFPLMYRTARGAFEQLDKNMIYVARTLGLSEHQIFWKIMIPNSFNSIIAGTILSFARALGEFGATIMIAGNIPGKTQTMAVAVYSAVQAGDRALAYRWVVIITIISFLTMILLNKFEKGKIEAYCKGGK